MQPALGPKSARFAERLLSAPPWAYFGTVVGSILALWLLAWLLPSFREGLVEPHLWGPILRDEGYNPYNTALVSVYALIGLAWFFSLLRSYRTHMDGIAAVVAILFFTWGAVLRVLEDADFFAPYARDSEAMHRACDTSLPGTLLDQCLGAAMITPLLWIWGGALLFLLARLGLAAERLAALAGAGAGRRFYALTLVASGSLHLAFWAADPSFVRLAPSPATIVAAHGAAFLVAHAWTQRRPLRWPIATLGYAMVLLLVALDPVARWFFAPAAAWSPTEPTHSWVLLALVLAPGVVAAGAWAMGRAWSRGTAAPARSATGALLLFAYLLVLVGLAAFATVLGLRTMSTSPASSTAGLALLAAGPLAVLVCAAAVARAAGRPKGRQPRFAVFAGAAALLMLASQAADALMTGLGLDAFGAAEKHLVPRTLIGWAAAAPLPWPVADFPATVVMLAYKLAATVGVVWFLEARLTPQGPRGEDLRWLVRLLVVAVSLGPAVRDALRLAMGV